MNRADIRSLDIGMLRTFEALMRERSVSRAAARLFLSQSAVSASLQRLREVFDDPLFKRTGHGVEPTPRALAEFGNAVQHAAAMCPAGVQQHLITAGFEPRRGHVETLLGPDRPVPTERLAVDPHLTATPAPRDEEGRALLGQLKMAPKHGRS